MSASPDRRARRRRRRLALGGIATAATMTVGAGFGQASAASSSSAFFALGVLTVVGTPDDNAFVISRDSAGALLVNGGAIPVSGGTPTVANTRQVLVIGLAGNDVLTMDEANGALPAATMITGAGNDSATGGSGNDLLIGQSGNDTLLGRGGNDRMFGGSENDTLTGGDADDQAYGEAGDDRMIWNPGEDNDLNEGGDGNDTTEVNGAGGAEQFTATANGTRVRFDRVDPAPFFVDIGTTENLVLNAGGGDDSFSATGNLAALIKIVVDGGIGNDTILGSNGADVFIGGDGNDFVDGQQGNDVGFMGAGDDVFQWDPGDGNDIIEGQDGTDSMLFNGSGANENFEFLANGGRVIFTRNVANIVMDLNDVERTDLNALGGADNLVVNDLSGTDMVEINTDLSATIGSGVGDAQPDTVVANATNGDDVAVVAGDAAGTSIAGLPATINVTGAEAGVDAMFVNALNGDDVVEASGLQATAMQLRMDGGDGDDILFGGDGDDIIAGGEGDDVLLGGPGTDALDGGPGDNVLIDGENLAAGAVQGAAWLAEHVTEANGDSIVEHAGEQQVVPGDELADEAAAAEAAIAESQPAPAPEPETQDEGQPES